MLYLGADFPETAKRHADNVTIFGISDKSDKETEAQVIAKTICEYVDPEDPMYVLGEDGEYRPAQYGDMAVLMRSTKNEGQQLLEILNAHGIPAHLEAKSGFFDTREIRMIVSLLTILDNPRHDIALAAVLRGPIGKMSDDDLAKIRGNSEELQFTMRFATTAARKNWNKKRKIFWKNWSDGGKRRRIRRCLAF